MISTMAAEWQMLRQRLVFLATIAIFAGVVLIAYAFLYWSVTHPSAAEARRAARDLAGLYPDQFLMAPIQLGFRLGGAVAIVAGGLLSAGEYGWGTLQTLLTQRPGRLTVISGRLVTLGAWMALLTALLFGSAALSSVSVAVLQGHAIALPAAGDMARATGATWLMLSGYALLGAVLGFLFRHAAAAVGAGLIYVVIIEGVVARTLSSIDWAPAQDVAKLFIGVNAGALSQSLIGGTSPTIGPGQATLVIGAYALAFAAVSAALVQGRDVT